MTGLLLTACNTNPVSEFHSENFELIKLSEGVFACIHKFGGKAICNAGIIDNGRETIIFDTFLSPEAASELPELAETQGLSPVKYVVNSHAHNDHIRGNQVFPEDVEIISTPRTRELIEQWERKAIPAEQNYAPPLFAYWDSLYGSFSGDTSSREYITILMMRPYFQVLAESHLEVKTRLPGLLMDEEMKLDGPGRRVLLISKGAGHTDSDMILYLPDDGVLFTADLVFFEMHPYLGQGDPDRWLAYLDYMLTLDFTTLVPGHGQVCGKEGILAMKSYINTLQRLSEKLVSENVPLDSISRVPVPPEYEHWWFENFFGSNLKFMYDKVLKNKTEETI